MDKLEDQSSEEAKALRGRSRSQWINWLIISSNKFTMNDLSREVGVSKRYLYKKDYVETLSECLINERYDNLSLLRRKLKKNCLIKLLNESWDPKDILEDKFGIDYRSPSQLKSFVNTLFSDEILIFEEIIRLYSINSDEILKKYN